MPNITSIQHGPEPDDGTGRPGPWRLYIRATDGREFHITAPEIVALYARQSGSAAQRRTATIRAVTDLVAQALGNMVDFALDLDLDGTTGRASRFGAGPAARPKRGKA
jgi:hypothetical protein